MTCTWNIRRHAGRVVAVASAAAVLSGLTVSQASASNLGDLQQQAASIEARINNLGNQEEALSERYDQAEGALAQVRKQVAAAKGQVAAANVRAARARKVLADDAIDAYVNNGNSSLSQSGGSSTVGGADSSLLRVEYEQSLASNQTDSEDAYKLASRQAGTAEDNLKVQETAAAANLKTIGTDRAELQSSVSSLESTEAQVKGQIATAIAQQEAAQRAAAQRAAAARLAAERQAAAAAAAATPTTTSPVAPITDDPSPTTTTAPSSDTGSGTGVTSGPTPTTTPPPVSGGESSVAAAAVAAAESRVGDPYVWGAAGPSSFDCSGLVMWAYAQAGVSLPHFSGAQYADTTHISMSDLEPGDLLFFSDPDIHVAMYVGNGDIIQAPYTGADVQIVPLYSELTLAGRVS